MSAHRLTAAVAFPATEPGALSGHEARCSCGFVARTSLSAREADKQAQAHVAWARRSRR